MTLTFPKPKDRKRKMLAGVKIFPDGREVCDKMTALGRQEYKLRVEAMWFRQFGVCCLCGFLDGCPGALFLEEATFEHEDGRGMNGAKRDDRIEKNGRRYNGAAHEQCNFKKGSTFIGYNNRHPYTITGIESVPSKRGLWKQEK